MKTINFILIGIFLFTLTGCQTTPTQDGALLGGALGSASGAIIGHQMGKQGEGALIGAGVGALTGALIGDQVGQQRQRQQQHHYYYERDSYYTPSSRRIQDRPTYVERGRYETRIVRTPSGEVYEERVWIPER